MVAGQPLDTVRVRQQAAVPAAAQRAGGSGGLALLRSIAAGEGVRHLFRGLTYPLLTAALQVTVGRCPADCEAYNEHSQPVPFYGLIPLVLPPAFLQNAVVFQSYGTTGRLLQQLEGQAGASVQPQLDGQQQPTQQQQPAQQRQLLSLSHVFWAGCAAGMVQTVSCCWRLS